WGQNLADGGYVGLSKRYNNETTSELGGFIDVIYGTQELGEFSFVVSRAQIINPDYLNRYSYNSTSQRVTNDGVQWNEIESVYWKYPLESGLNVVVELSHYTTSRKTNDGNSVFDGVSLEGGMLYNF